MSEKRLRLQSKDERLYRKLQNDADFSDYSWCVCVFQTKSAEKQKQVAQAKKSYCPIITGYIQYWSILSRFDPVTILSVFVPHCYGNPCVEADIPI